jgi:uncharacterized protein
LTSFGAVTEGAERAGVDDLKIPDQGVSWNYTTWLNIAFLVLAAALITPFFRTGGLAMLRMMGGSPDSQEHDHMDAPASH